MSELGFHQIKEGIGPDEKRSLDGVTLADLLREARELNASDLHLTVYAAPTVRVDGRLRALDYERLSSQDIQRLVYGIISEERRAQFETERELDFSYGIQDVGRFRFNVYWQRGSVSVAARAIPMAIPSMEELGLPLTLRDLVQKQDGLVLVTGPTGCGKTTTIATMVDWINRERDCCIVTIEDPIEYLHRHQTSLVDQRELGSDTRSFENALRAVLREDPDVVVIGEMRDLETISSALTLAETGHLVFGTLHTRNAPQTIDRIIDVFPPHQQSQVRNQLGNVLDAVIAQQLVPRLGGGRLACIEMMLVTPAIRNLIREGKTHQIYSCLETGREHGSRSMDSALAQAIENGWIARHDAYRRASSGENLDRLLKAA